MRLINRNELESLKSKLRSSQSNPKSVVESKKRKRISGRTKYPIKQTETCPECKKLMYYMEDSGEMFCPNCGYSSKKGKLERYLTV